MNVEDWSINKAVLRYKEVTQVERANEHYRQVRNVEPDRYNYSVDNFQVLGTVGRESHPGKTLH